MISNAFFVELTHLGVLKCFTLDLNSKYAFISNFIYVVLMHYSVCTVLYFPEHFSVIFVQTV
jgi:hypothetical protein